jgi:hypothetical protein
MSSEVTQGRLKINGVLIPLGRGLIFRALAKAGWTGLEGALSEELTKNLLRADPRIEYYTLHEAPLAVG